MAAPVNANINVFANTEQAMAQFRALQAQVAATNKSITATSGTAVAQQAALNKALMDGANASKMWSARMVPMNTAVQQFSTALDKGKLSLGQYTRYAASQLPGMSRVFKREFEMMNRVATQNVKQMQTQYVTLGQSAQGAAQAMALTPTALNKHAAASAIATQRQMMLNRMIDLGTTKLLNYGKNTQWAGRQLMVGFSIPLAMVGAVAAKTFKEIDQGSIAFRRVYGDLSTTTAEMERNLQAVKDLGEEYTRYGLKLSDTIELAADVAATGAKNNDLLAATEQTLRLSTLGLMEYDEALEATIALQTAFGVSSEDLGSTIDFLNVVENETILTMQDMAAAIPRVAPVIKGLGGDVRDLAVLMTAMREGGVTAAEGANALKTGLGRLINPTRAARDVMDGFGISLTAMIQSNRGDLMGMINDFGAALATLDDFEQQQALEKVFGKRQYARLGALFKNIANDASQAQRTVELTNMSLEDLGAISERELGKIEEATSTKFAKAVEQLKISIAPIGEQFMKALTPVIGFITKIADKFNELPDNIKNVISIGIAAIAGIGPVVLMTIGLIANGIANIGKLIQTMRKFFARLRGNASAFEYLTQEEREAAAAARGLSGATDGLTTKFLGQQRALERLIQLLGTYQGALASTAAAAPLAMGVGRAGAVGGRTTISGPQSQTVVARGYNKGVVKVPGVGNKDTVPAMLTPGESVVTKEASQRYAPLISAMNAGSIPGFSDGVALLGGIPAPVSGGYKIQARSIPGVEGFIAQIKLVDGGLETLEAVLREFAQTGRQINQKLLKQTLEERGIRPPVFSQAAGNVIDRSHVIGLGVEKTGGLLSNLNAALQSSNPIVRDHAQRMMESSKVVQLYKNGQDVLAREVTETSQVFDLLQKGTMGLTGGFRGTVMATPQAINNLYNEMPQAIRGDTLSLKTFNQQVKWAEQEFRELASRLNLTTAELADDAVINNMVDESEKQRIKALRLLIAEGQETAQLQMSEQDFLRNRLKQMGLALQAEKGQTDATIANAEAERFATQQMQLLRQAGVIATDATIDYATAMQVLAASAMGQAGSLIVAGEGVPQQVAKRASQRLSAKGYDPVANMRSIPTSTIPSSNKGFSSAALIAGASRFAPIAQREGVVLGTAMGSGITQGATQSTRNAIPEVIKMMGHKSPHPLMAKTGKEDGVAYGNAWNQSVKKAIMTGSGKIVPPGGVVPPPTSPASGGRGGESAKNAAALKAAIMAPSAVTTTPVAKQGSVLRETARATVADIRRALSESSAAFRTIPQFAKVSSDQLKEAFKSMGPMIKQIAGPYIKPIVDAFKFTKDTIVTNVRGVAKIVSDGITNAANTAKTAAQNAAVKVKGAYETAALKTIMALDSVKTIPAKLRGAYETAALRVMTGLDAIKRFPQNVRNRVQTLTENLNPRRLANKAFYRGQDVVGRLRERFDRFRTGPAAAGAALREGAVSSATRALIPDKAFAKVEGAAQRLQSAAESARKFIKNAPKQIVDSAKQFAQSVAKAGAKVAQNVQNAASIVKTRVLEAGNAIRGRVIESANSFKNAAMAAGAALREGSIRGAVRALTPDSLAARINQAVQPMINAGKFIGEKVTAAGARLAQSGERLAISLRAAGAALREGSFRDAVRALTPDKVRAAVSGAVNTIKTIPSIIKGNTIAAFEIGKSAIINGFNSARNSIISAGSFLRDTVVINVKGALSIAKDAIVSSAQNLVTTVKNGLNLAKTKLVNEFNRVSEIVRTQGPLIAKSFKDAMIGIKGAAGSARTEMFKSGKNVGSALFSAGKGVAKMVTESGRLLSSAIRGAAAGVGGFMRGGVDAQGRTRGQRMAGMGNTGMMGLMGLSMAASFAGGEVGEMAQKIMPVTMGLMGLQMILPMLTNPLGLAIIAITAAVGSFIYLRKQLDDAAKAAANVGANMNGVANAMKIIEDATGFKAPDNQDRLFRFTDEDREAMGEFGSYFESEGGSKFIKELKEASSEERYQRVFALLSQGIASGLEEEKAKSFGFAIAEATGDALLKSSIARDFANQIFEGGSARLLEMEEERIRDFPALPEITGYDQLSRTQRTVAERNVELPLWQRVMDLNLTGNWQSMPSIGDFQLPSPTAGFVGQVLKEIGETTGWFELPDIPVITTTWTEAAAESETVTEKAAKGLGYYLQTVQNLANAEAVLEEERRNGLITFEQYTERFNELQGLQDAASEYIGDIFSIGADAGSMMQALGDQLSFAGFSEEQIKRITDRFNPDALAQEIFGADNFQSLELKEQKDYIEKIMTETLSGLSPENVEQRLADIEGTYTDIAEKVVQAMVDGSGQGIDFFFNQQNMADYISQRMGGGLGATLPGGEGRVSPEDLAENLLDADMDLKRLGTDALEVFTRLTEFSNQDFAKSIMNSKNEILNFGDAVTKLAEYEDINIEVVMEKGIDPDSILYAINQIKDIEFDIDIFGNAAYDADLLTQKMIDLGYDASLIPGIVKAGVAEATSEIGQLSDNAFNKLNNIKITPNTMLKLFDTEYASSGGFISALESVFPDELPPSVLPILLQILNPEQIQALASLSEEAAAALMDNPELSSYSPTGGMYGLGETISDTAREAAQILNFAKDFMGSAVSEGKDERIDDGGTSGSGAAQEKSALEELQESIEERASLYLGVTKAGKKLDKAKKGYFGRLLAETTTNNSIANQLRKLNISESLIADILATGAKNAEEIINQLGPSGIKRLSKSDILSRAGELISDKRGETRRGEFENKARRRLEQEGFDTEEIEDILQDEATVEIIANLPKKATRVWKQLFKALRDAANATKEVRTESEKAADEFDLVSTRMDAYIEAINQAFDAEEGAVRDRLSAEFLQNTGMTTEEMQEQINANNRLIDQQQDLIDAKQEQVNDYQRENDLIKQNIDDLKRQDEMRNRRSEVLSRALDQITKAEDQIRETYQKRIDALDKVAEINDYIVEQQKQQLDLSRAISEGDIYAATQAAQDMRAASAQQAATRTRAGLEQGMENAIAGLVSDEGMSRVEIEEEINNIKEQNYQNSLLIRQEEDKIYQNNLLIRDLNNQIYDINENMIEPLANQNKEYERMLSYYKEDEEYALRRVVVAGMTRQQFEDQADELQRSIKNAQELDPWLEGLVGKYSAMWEAAKGAADEAERLARIQGDADRKAREEAVSNNYAGGLIKKYAVGGMVNPLRYTSNEPPPARRYAGGSIGGEGSRDSVPAMLTPGEFVIRKAMVDKYGVPMMKALNQGSFAMPRYNVGEGMMPEVEMTTNNMVSNINAPVYNSYDMKFAINGTSQSADEIANTVMFKMRQLQNQGIRTNRGY